MEGGDVKKKEGTTSRNEEERWEEEQRHRLATHESAHAAMTYELGRPIEVVSIRASKHKHFGGVAPYVPARRGMGFKAGFPAMLQPPSFRRAIEVDICILLAGRVGEDLLWQQNRWGVSEDERQAEAIVQEFAKLSKRESAVIERLENRDEPIKGDEMNAWELVQAFSDEEAAAHLAYLREVTKSIVCSSGFVRLVDALVPVLLAQDVVSGRACRQIFRGVDQGRRPLAVAASE